MASLAVFKSALEFMLALICGREKRKVQQWLRALLSLRYFEAQTHVTLGKCLKQHDGDASCSLAFHYSLHMRYLCLLFTAILACLACCKAAVVQITDENFTDLIGKEDEWLIDL